METLPLCMNKSSFSNFSCSMCIWAVDLMIWFIKIITILCKNIRLPLDFDKTVVRRILLCMAEHIFRVEK